MKQGIYLVISSYLLVFFTACNDTPSTVTANALQAVSTPAKSFTGLFYYDKEVTRFVDCTDGLSYALVDSTSKLKQFYADATQMMPCQGEPVWGAVQGRIDANTSQLTVLAIDSIAAMNKLNACIPFDYWCSGTEPFWSLSISKTGKAAYFKDLGTEKGYSFDYSEPMQQNGGLLYTLVNKSDPKSQMTILIKKEDCSDGMSDISYQYSASIQFRGQKWKGCAEKWGEVHTE
ncbi:MAG: hypothetical protein RIR11_2245 [Bacteroidota bacterium]|jgi:uncharacterized membrane protein